MVPLSPRAIHCPAIFICYVTNILTTVSYAVEKCSRGKYDQKLPNDLDDLKLMKDEMQILKPSQTHVRTRAVVRFFQACMKMHMRGLGL